MLSNEPSHGSPPSRPAVALLVRHGGLLWAATSEPGIDVIALVPDTSGELIARREHALPLAEIEPETRGLINRIRLDVQRSEKPVRHMAPASKSHKGIACAYCGGTDWQVSEATNNAFASAEGAMRPVSTIDRAFSCAACQRIPEGDEELETAYMEAQTDEGTLAAAAKAVVGCWEHGDLAAAVRMLASALEETGWGVD